MKNPYEPSTNPGAPRALPKGAAFLRAAFVFCVGGIVGVTAIHIATGSMGEAVTRMLSRPGNLLFSIVLALCLYLSTFFWKLPRRLFFQPFQPTMIASFASGAFLNCLLSWGIRSTSERQLDSFINQYSALALLLIMAAVAMLAVALTVELECVLTRLTCKSQLDGEQSNAPKPPS